MMGDNEIRQSNRMEWVKNRTDIESTYGKVSMSWMVSAMSPERRQAKEKDCTGAKEVDEQRCQEM